MRWASIEQLLLTDVFPDQSGYHTSRWATWESRIQQGHKAEEQQIERIYERRSEEVSAEPPDHDPGELAGEDYLETCRLTSTMYAALIVGIWSEMEHFLKSVVRLCYQALDKRRIALTTTKRFCEDSLAEKKPTDTLESCIKAMKELASDVPFAFDDIKKALRKEVSIDVEQCTDFLAIDAIRILNNSFKHSRGRYEPESGQAHTQIHKSLLNKWPILDERNEIDYSKLPVEELVLACNGFCQDLLGKVENVLERKCGGATDGR
jgi:hypothetical protein